MRLFVFCLFFSIGHALEVNFHDFDAYQHRLSKAYVKEKIQHHLEYQKGNPTFYEIQEDALVLFASAEDKEQGIPEYKLFFGNQKTEGQKTFKLSKPLKEARIALDPGHFGGDLSRIEERYVSLEHEGKTLAFDEGTLAFLTAAYLKKRLEAEGATVLMTRQAIGEGAYEENFFDWLKQHPEHWTKGASLSSLFRKYYNRLDMRKRAERINAFQPDITFSIHYNAFDCDKLSQRNFNLVFIPGAFCKGELATAEDRYHFLRLVCTDDLEHSFHLAKKLIGSFTDHLEIPPLTSTQKSGFNNSLLSAKGVFHRNLCLTRLVKGPFCYGETLIQNNLEEALQLNQKDAIIEGIPCSQRIIEVAEAYFETICSIYL